VFYFELFCSDVREYVWCVSFFARRASFTSFYCVGSFNVDAFAQRLWGDVFFLPKTRKFTRKANDPEHPRTFVQFVLEPLYKLYSSTLSEETDTLKTTLAGLGIQLKAIMYKMDVRPLLKAILDQFFGPATGLVDMIVEKIPSPVEGNTGKVRGRSLRFLWRV
jgi:116 kDa U5 small nuclear ribonucleoprotein component